MEISFRDLISRFSFRNPYSQNLKWKLCPGISFQKSQMEIHIPEISFPNLKMEINVPKSHFDYKITGS